jgi:hypothetical protein
MSLFICVKFNGAFSSLNSKTSKIISVRLVIDECDRIWTEAVVA